MKEKKQELKRVLIVDDEPNITMILAAGLEKLGQNYQIDTVESGEKALARLADVGEYDLVLTDYRMPGINGVTLAQKIRHYFPNTQIIMMTAHSTPDLQEVVGNLALDGYIDKPVRLEKIREIVQEAIGRTHEGDDPYRAGEREVPESVHALLSKMQMDSNARCVLLLSASGFPIEVVGQVAGLDITSISALVAANFIAGTELARLLGNVSVFKSSHHEGPDYNIYAHDVNGDCLLAAIYGSETKTGIVRFYLGKALKAIVPLLEQVNPVQPVDLQELGWDTAVADELDNLFG